MELHGTDGAISMEQRRKETATEAVAVYQDTIGNVSQMDSIVLHHARINEILKWTKEHLDAYLASPADVIIDQPDEAAGLIFILPQGCIPVCIVDRELYGSDRCSVLVLIGVFKFLFESWSHLFHGHFCHEYGLA
jgi:hypothetical protein